MKIGLKLSSTDTQSYMQEALKLYEQGFFYYIELYIVPGVDTVKHWKKLKQNNKIPFNLHTPHSAHKFNLADSSMKKSNVEIFNQVEEFYNELEADYIVLHSGTGGNINETIKQLGNIIRGENIQDKYMIENKPYFFPFNANLRCRGAEIEEIKKVKDELGCGFCLDVGHSFCTANSLRLEPYEYLTEFNKLKPHCYHLSDNFVNSETDGHLNFGKGNLDYRKILSIIDFDKNMTIETKKNSKENLDDFIDDVNYLIEES